MKCSALCVLVVSVVVSVSGCIVTPLRQVAVATTRQRIETSAGEIGKAAVAVRDVAVELQTALKEDRPPDVGPALSRAGVALAAANVAANEAGEVVVALQEDIGATVKPVPQTPEALKTFLAEYRGIAKLWNMASAWVSKTVKGMWSGGSGSSPIAAAIEAWSPKEIAGLIATITVAAGGLGLGGKKVAAGVRSTRVLRATVLEAEAALGECNAAMEGEAFARIMAKYPLPVRVHIARRLKEA